MDDFKISLKAARVNAGLTQEQVCEKTGYARSTLYRWEHGMNSPKHKDLGVLCELYKVSIGCIEQQKSKSL